MRQLCPIFCLSLACFTSLCWPTDAVEPQVDGYMSKSTIEDILHNRTAEQVEEIRNQDRERLSFVVIDSPGQRVQTKPIEHLFPDLKYRTSDINNGTIKKRRRKRKAHGRVWPNGIIPYSFDGAAWGANQAYVERRIKEAIGLLEDKTCIKFQAVDQNYEGNQLKFISGDACITEIGMIGSSTQTIRLLHISQSQTCALPGIILHEICHVLGFIHEHSRNDRDNFITVHPGNIKSKYQSEYKVVSGAQNLFPYDLGSIMHYDVWAFASGSGATFTVRNEALSFLPGQRKDLTFYDAKTINVLYSCAADCMMDCQNEGYTFKTSEGKCVCVCPPYLTGEFCQNVITSADCGGVIELAKVGDSVSIGWVSTPDGTDSRTCVWLLKGPGLLRVHFTQFDIELDKVMDCPHSVEVRFNLLGQEAPKLCGRSPPGDISTKDDFGIHTTLLIVKESSSPFKGHFKATIHATDNDDPCLSNPCHGLATCVYYHSSKGYRCECPQPYIGPTCSDVDSLVRITEDFESSVGFLQNLPGNGIQWRRMSGSTVTSQSGPQGGVNGSSTYLYCEASIPFGKGHTAQLATPYLSSRYGRCIGFYYHMYGSSMGKFELLQERRNTTNNSPFSLLSLSGDQGDSWKRAEINITADTAEYRVVFKYTKDGSKGDLAIDNIETYPGLCGSPVRIVRTTPNTDLCICGNSTCPCGSSPGDKTKNSGTTASHDFLTLFCFVLIYETFLNILTEA